MMSDDGRSVAYELGKIHTQLERIGDVLEEMRDLQNGS